VESEADGFSLLPKKLRFRFCKQTDFRLCDTFPQGHDGPSVPPSSTQGLYLIFELITALFFRLTSWILGNMPRELRPRPSSPLKKSDLIKDLRQFNVEGGIKMHFSGSVENKNLLYRTDSLQFFGDHSTVSGSRCETCLGRAHTPVIK
jgi:hypothetical protein